MLAQIYRLKKSGEIKKVLEKGRYAHINGLFMMKWLPNGKEHHRMTIVVSTKVSKKAVIRNKIKRSLIGMITKEFLRTTGNQYYDIVCVVKKIDLTDIKKAQNKIVDFFSNKQYELKNATKKKNS